MRRYPFKYLLTFAVAAGSALHAQQNAPADQAEFFEKRIRPLLIAKCQGCHNAKVKTSGLDLSSGAGFLAGGPSGPLLSKEHPEQSLLLQVTSYEARLKMPPMGKLTDDEQATLKAWVTMGAPWPGAVASAATGPGSGRQITDKDRAWWAFQPVKRPSDAKSIDQFITAKLTEKGLKSAPRADRMTLLRRATYDLTGLPPTEEEIKAFVDDKAPDAFAKVVDRLLASPRYGEKWGRHWLDVARYADSTGNDEDHRYPHAWKYRDYVIDAFNRDMPYDQFLREQIAGDLMPAEKPGEINRRGIVATGFLALGAKAIAQQDKKKMLYDVYDEQVDVTTRAFLGVTLACARCHDHKFDPLLTRDYYSMVGMFAATKSFKDPDTHVSQLLFVPLDPKEKVEKFRIHQQRVTNKATEIEDLLDSQAVSTMAGEVKRVAEYMIAARRVYVDKAVAAAVAKESGLSLDILNKWAKYLLPHPEARPHLDRWYAATPETLSTVAGTYQAEMDKHLAEWSKQVEEWRSKYFGLTEDQRAMNAPAKPKFDADKGRFFFETYTQGPFATSQEGRRDRSKGAPADLLARIEGLKKEQAALKASMPPEPDMACAVEDGAPVQQKVFLRGDYNSLGVDAPKAVPVVLTAASPQPEFAPKGSGRLELANWMARPDNPLTARVMVNRIWYWHLGEGLVRTPDNFGRMGERPTHPELLDYLADEFVKGGWSAKKLHRQILLSDVYQSSSTITEEAFAADPENRLFSRFPRRRLAVEEMRDGLLSIDGSIDLTVGGTLQSGTGTDGENSNGRLSLRPESNKRRMVYLPLRRANLPSLLNLFDFGDATTLSGKRTLTTVAPQALFMMNSDFIAERAKLLAESAEKQSSDPQARVKALYRRILNREAGGGEVDGALSYVKSFQDKYAANKRTDSDAWFSLVRILLSSNEFIYLD